MNVHNSFIHNSEKVETAQMSFNRWMVKEMVVNPYCGILFGNKTEQIIGTLNNLDGSQGNYAQWKKSISKGYTPYDSIYMTF